MTWTVDEVLASRDRGMENFRDLWRFLQKEGERVELHTLENLRGPFANRPGRRFVGSYEEAVAAWEQSKALYRPDGSYIRMNHHHPEVEQRRGAVSGLWHCPPYGLGCSAQDITRIESIYQDLDPLPKVDCATEAQTRACVETGLRIIEEYSTIVPVEAMGIGPSGNGAMVLLATETFGNTLETARLIQMLGKGSLQRHGSDQVKLDQLTDAGRLIPACGNLKRRTGTGKHGTSPLKPTGFVCAPEVVRITRAQLVQLVEAFGAPIDRIEHFSQIRAAKPEGDSWRDRARAIPIERLYVVLATSSEGQRFGLNPDPIKPCCPRCISMGGLGRRGRGVILATYGSRWPANKLRCQHDTCGHGQTRLNNIDLVTWVLCGYEMMKWTDETRVKEWFLAHFGRDLGVDKSPRPRLLRFKR